MKTGGGSASGLLWISRWSPDSDRAVGPDRRVRSNAPVPTAPIMPSGTAATRPLCQPQGEGSSAVVVLAGEREQPGGEKGVVQAPPAVVPGDRLPGPTRRPRRVPVACSKRIAIAEIAQTGDDPELGSIPLGPPLPAQLAVRVAGERDRRAVRQFAPRSVQITHTAPAARGLESRARAAAPARSRP